MKLVILKIMMLLLICISINLFAQNSIDVRADLYSGLDYNNVLLFLINARDTDKLENSPLLFWIEITNYYPTAKSVVLKFSIYYDDLTTGETLLADGITNPFVLQPGTLFINNLNLFSQANQYEIENFTIYDTIDDLIEDIISLGKMPSGKYRFLISIEDSSSDDIVIEISYLATIDLISPGEPAGSSDIMEIYTTLPLFQWESDANEFRIKVCEKLSTNNSPEEVMNNEPRLEQIVNTTTFQYPAVGAFNLQEGKTYYWQVLAINPFSSGPSEIESEIWEFKIANVSNGQSTAMHMQLINYLKILLGDNTVDNFFKENGELANYMSTGIIINDGVIIKLQDLNILIDKFQNGEIKINGYSIE